MALLEYIKDHLLFSDSVTLPGLGSFEISRSSSRIVGNKISPPGLKIVFNTEKSFDDGILAKSIADAEEISIEEARQKVLEYIDDIVFALNKGEAYVFEGFGKLSRDSENIFRFEKNKAFKIEFESSGLESFELDPIEELLIEEKKEPADSIVKKTEESTDKQPEKSESKTFPPKKKTEVITSSGTETVKEPYINNAADPMKEHKNNSGIVWILAGAVMVILVAFVLIRMTTDLLDGPGLSFFNTEKESSSGVFPEDDDWDIESTLNSELGEAIDSMTLQENALTIDETSEPIENPADETIAPETEGYKEFHIIAGSFKDKINAGILQQSLTEQGYPALVIQQGDQLYRVSAISFKDKEQGLQELGRFKLKTRNNAAWLLGLN